MLKPTKSVTHRSQSFLFWHGFHYFPSRLSGQRHYNLMVNLQRNDHFEMASSSVQRLTVGHLLKVGSHYRVNWPSLCFDWTRVWKIIIRRIILLTLSQTSPGFYVSVVEVFWKHCGKRRNLSQQAPWFLPIWRAFCDFQQIWNCCL